MIPKLMVSVSILAIAIVAFTGLAFQTVPMSTTQTVTQASTERLLSYSPYFVASTTTSILATTESYRANPNNCSPYPFPPSYPNPCLAQQPFTYWTLETHTWGVTVSTQTQWYTATIPYSQTATSSVTESSTNIVPAYSSIGLTGSSFGALSIVVIGILAFVAAWFALKSKTSHGPKQAIITQFVKVSNSCVKCGADLPPNSSFCNRCGTKQP